MQVNKWKNTQGLEKRSRRNPSKHWTGNKLALAFVLAIFDDITRYIAKTQSCANIFPFKIYLHISYAHFMSYAYMNKTRLCSYCTYEDIYRKFYVNWGQKWEKFLFKERLWDIDYSLPRKFSNGLNIKKILRKIHEKFVYIKYSINWIENFKDFRRIFFKNVLKEIFFCNTFIM